MNARVCLLLLLAAMMPLLSGCQRLNDERTVHVTAGSVQPIEFDPPRYDQKLTVSVHSPGAPVTVYLVRQENSEAAQNRMYQGKAPEESLAGKEKVEETTLEATVPAKTAFALLIRADKTTAEVHLKTTGR
jgi:hypothetical protein